MLEHKESLLKTPQDGDLLMSLFYWKSIKLIFRLKTKRNSFEPELNDLTRNLFSSTEAYVEKNSVPNLHGSGSLKKNIAHVSAQATFSVRQHLFDSQRYLSHL